MKMHLKLLGLGAAVVVLGAGLSAQATLLAVRSTTLSTTSVGITYPGGSRAAGFHFGVYNMGVYGGTDPYNPGSLQSSWNSICLSPAGTISGYESVTLENFAPASPGQFPGSWSLDGIYNAAYIYNKNIDGVTTADQGTALALAVLKALYDSNGYGTWSSSLTGLSSTWLTKGTFKATGVNSTQETDFEGYVAGVNPANINANNCYVGSVYYVGSDPTSGTGQEFITRGTPVPEPTTMIAGALMLLPFGASMLRFMRKNRAA